MKKHANTSSNAAFTTGFDMIELGKGSGLSERWS